MLKQYTLVLALSSSLLSLAACQHQETNFIYMPDMVYSPAVKAQSGQPRYPVEGTVPRVYGPNMEVASMSPAEAAGLKNPLPRTREVMLRGQHVFNNTCIVCHGPNGEGDGSVVPKFPRPPSLQSDKIRKWPDGNIFHVITKGQNLMYPYASQVAPEDRWAVIHYIRALQRSKHPTPEDLKLFSAEAGK